MVINPADRRIDIALDRNFDLETVSVHPPAFVALRRLGQSLRCFEGEVLGQPRFHGDDGVLYHDIMSYDPGQTIPYFSNPRLQYQNAPLGNRKTADSARTITLTAPYVATYRRARA